MSEIIEAKKKVIEDAFSSIIGQQAAVKACKQSLLSFIYGGELKSFLFVGEAGLGKTAIMAAIHRALSGLEFPNVTGVSDNGGGLVLPTPSAFRGAESEDWLTIKNTIIEQSYALFIDECHELYDPKNYTVQLGLVRQYLLRSQDGNFKGGHIQLSEKVGSYFSRQSCSVITGTNFPGKIPDAIKSRFGGGTNLVHYKENELVSILITMLAARGLHVRNEDILGQIARCGRGTARPMEKITDQLRLELDSRGETKETISQKNIFDALKALEMFPRGCNKLEMQLLDKMRAPSPSRVIRPSFPSMDKTTWEKATGHLLSLASKNGIPFLTIRRNGDYATTEAGIKFLQVSHDEGFRWTE